MYWTKFKYEHIITRGKNTDIETTRKPKVPLICLLSTGSDPSPQIESIAKVGLIDQPLISFIIHTFIIHTFLSHSQESRSTVNFVRAVHKSIEAWHLVR